jgi:ATP-dependent exoDNAse (exonuclease V) beta subunit
MGDTVKKHIVDRTFVEDGVRWVIDYKTAVVEGDLSAAAESYREQLQAYAALFSAQGLPVKCAILFMHVGALVVLKQ